MIEDKKVFVDGFTDHDCNDFLRLLNKYMRVYRSELWMVDTATGERRLEWDVRLVYACLWWCEREMDMFA